MKILKLIKTHKVVTAVIAAVLITGIAALAVGFVSVGAQKKQNEQIEDIAVRAEAMISIDNIESLTQESINRINADMKSLEGKKLSEENAIKLNTAITNVDDAQTMFNLMGLTSGLLDEKDVLAENIDTADIDKARETAEQLNKNDPFYIQQMEIINKAQDQLDVIDQATIKLNKLFTASDRKKVNPDAERKAYADAAKAIDFIKRQSDKTALTADLKKADDYLSEQEAKAEAEKKAAAEEKAKQQAASGSSGSGGSGNSGGSGTSGGSGSSGNSGGTSGGSNNTGNNENIAPDEFTPGQSWEGTLMVDISMVQMETHG